jgi:hypothetical protein
MSKVFLIDLTIWGMLNKHCDRNISPLYHAFTPNLGEFIMDHLRLPCLRHCSRLHNKKIQELPNLWTRNNFKEVSCIEKKSKQQST